MAELALVDELNGEQRSELDSIERGTPDLERQIRAAMVAVETEERDQETTETDAPDAEMRERVELRSRASLTNYLLAAARGRMVDGAEAELATAAGVQGIPLELWDVLAQNGERETRAVTPAPGTVGINLDPIRPAVFANSIAQRLGIAMPRVSSGTYATATIGTSQTVAAKDKSAAIDATAGALTVTTATPKRVSARLELTLEDIAAVGQAKFESILRENLSLALSDELDDQAINGDGSAQPQGGCVSKVVEIGFGASPSGLSFAAVRPRGQGFRRRLADRGFPIHRLCASGFGRKRGAPRGASALFRDTAARSVF